MKVKRLHPALKKQHKIAKNGIRMNPSLTTTPQEDRFYYLSLTNYIVVFYFLLSVLLQGFVKNVLDGELIVSFENE